MPFVTELKGHNVFRVAVARLLPDRTMPQGADFLLDRAAGNDFGAPHAHSSP